MGVDLAPDPEVAALTERTAAFVRESVVPVEIANSGVVPSEEVRRALQHGARDACMFAPHVSPEFGGHGLDMRARAVVFEEAGYSLLGPLALNIAAPEKATCTCWNGSRPRTRTATWRRWPPATCGRASP